MDAIIATLAWPVAFVIICIAGFLIFRAQVANLIARTRKVGKGGLETFEAQTPEKETSKGAEEFIRAFDNQLLVGIESSIQRDLETRKITTPADRERTLTRALAAAQIALHFERLSRAIWASQLELLRFVNSRQDGVPLAELMFFYERAKSAYPDWYEAYAFDAWWGFLQSFNVVAVQDSRAFITVAGREFLKFLVDTGKAGPYHG